MQRRYITRSYIILHFIKKECNYEARKEFNLARFNEIILITTR